MVKEKNDMNALMIEAKRLTRFEQVTHHDAGGKEHTTILALVLDAKGNPIPVLGDKEPDCCDHAGATWSQDFDIRCPRCGARLFLPPGVLANKDQHTAASMYRCWRDAGSPEYSNRDGWIFGLHQAVQNHPLFEGAAGIPVDATRLDLWLEMWGGA